MPFYNCRSHSGLDYIITKLSDDLEPEHSYILIPIDGDATAFACDCPAGVRPTCRHRQMLPHFINAGRVNSGWVLDWDNEQSWRQYVGPFGDDGSIEFAPVEEYPGEVTDPAGQFEQYQSFASDAPGHTDLMVPPESIPDFVEEAPTPSLSPLITRR